MEIQQVKCRKCENLFSKSDIIVTLEGFFCVECIPEDVDKRFFKVHLSWQGMNAIVDFIDGDADVEQLMILDKIKEKLSRIIMDTLRELVKEYGGRIQEPDSESLGTGDAEH